MKKSITKKLIAFSVLLMSAVVLNAQDAASIVNSARNRNQSETLQTRSRMVTAARNGSTSTLELDQYSKDGPNGSRTMIVFRAPASQAGTRFLSMNNASGGTDQWIYLPSLGRSRRISASDSGGSFMGTDFYYDDISLMDRDSSLDTHTLLREETLNGSACYVIQSVPKDTSYIYSKLVIWIDKSNNRIYKTEMYNRRGELVKVLEISNYENVEGHDTPRQTKVTTVGTGTSTTIYMDIIQYDRNIPEGVFTTNFLDTGRY